MDIKLTNGDLAVEDGNLVILTGVDSIVQNLSIRLRMFKGEWFLNQDIGIPYLETILKKNPNPSIVQSKFRQAILSTPGVLELLSFSFDWNKETRLFSLTFRALTTEGPVDFSEEFILT